LYSNNDNFKTIEFDKGINFILSYDNGVGKSTLFKLIDFCLLGDKHFLAQEHFKDYIFYIELQIASKNGIKRLRVDSSITVKIFFESFGFIEVSENKVKRDNQILTNYSLELKLS
ncbi:AAA family ATPase, partial [Poseidonibacter sp.]|uniref:AAA family ATPase n=1 Tax=Poseidonibacter sp. TaxID=2321188 RepID=UPI003C76F443